MSKYFIKNEEENNIKEIIEKNKDINSYFEKIKIFFLSKKKIYEENEAYKSACMIFLAAGFTSAILHPFDLIKIRMQVSDVTNGAIVCHRHTYSAAKNIYKNEKIFGFYKGLSASIIANAFSWGLFKYTYECCRKQCNVYAKDEKKIEEKKNRRRNKI